MFLQSNFLQSKFIQRIEESPSQTKIVQRQEDEAERNRLGQIHFGKASSEIAKTDAQADGLQQGEVGPKAEAQIADEALSSIVYAIKEEMRVKKAWGRPTDITVVVEGLASKEGKSKLNQKLSKSRAEAVKTRLLAQLKKSKADTSKITIITTGLGIGKRQEENYHLDRKATVYILKKTVKLNQPGSIIKPNLTEDQKIAYIKDLLKEGNKTALAADEYVFMKRAMKAMAEDVLPLPGLGNEKQLAKEGYLEVYEEYMQRVNR